MEEVAWDDPLPQVLGQEDGSQGQGSSSLGSSSQPLATLLIRLHHTGGPEQLPHAEETSAQNPALQMGENPALASSSARKQWDQGI